LIGQVVGNYRISSELGRGGMGIVYRGEHVQLGRPVAIKMLLPQLSNDPGIVQRFFNEARAASAIDHPGIVEIIDFGYADGQAFLVMALLKGESLEQRLQRGPLPPLEGASLVAQVVAALAAAHARGIVHRDLKPDNIFLVPNELMPNGVQVKLLDFGIAKLAGDRGGEFKTQTGMLIGTPAYMSPEQCMGKSDLDHRTDLYSIGCILFHVLCGRPPFVGEGGTGMMIAAHLRDPAPHPNTIDPRIPPPLAAIVMRLLEKDPAARYQTASEVRQALVAAGATSPTKVPVVDPVGQTMASIGPGRTAMAYAPTTAPTTGAGSAAQMVPVPARRSSALPWIIAATLVAAVAGVGIFVMVTRGPVAQGPAAPPAPPPDRVAEAPDTARAEAAAPTPQAPCPPGQARSDDTRGQCCWPDQAWANAGQRCVGKPRCPEGRTAKGEDCVAAVAAVAPTRPLPEREPPDAPSGTPKPRLAAKSYAPNADVVITFAAPVPSKTTNRYWVAIAAAGSAPSVYGPWTFVEDGATSVTLKAPGAPGSYELRLHGNYPAKSFDIKQAVRFEIADAAKPVAGMTPLAKQRFSLASSKVPAGGHAELVFAAPLHAASGEKFWITIVTADATDSTWGKYDYVTGGARGMKLEVPKAPGEYEIRLHGNYPRLTTNVVFRARITVE